MSWIIHLNHLVTSLHDYNLSLFLYKKLICLEHIEVQILSKYTPKRTKLHHIKKILRGACHRTPLANGPQLAQTQQKSCPSPCQILHALYMTCKQYLLFRMTIAVVIFYYMSTISHESELFLMKMI